MKLAHVILRVADMERALGFYRDAVGLEVLSESPDGHVLSISGWVAAAS